MQKPFYRIILSSLFVLFSYAGYIWLRIQHILRIREPREFYDTVEFIDIASLPLNSAAFWVGIKPPATSLLFKLVGANPNRIMMAQVWISIFAWGTLALVLALVIRNFWLKPVAFIFVLAFSLVQNVILWDSLLLSESLSLSLLALFLASSFWLLAKWQAYRFVLFAMSVLLLANVRDTYAYFMLMAGAVLLVLLFFSNQRLRILLVSGVFFVSFLMVMTFSAIGMRWYVPFLMSMGMRILPNPDYVSYFEARGLPVSDSLMERAGKPIQADEIAMLYDPALEEFRQWVVDHGRGEFIRFLWFYKADTLQNPIRDLEWVFNPDVYYYAATGYRPIIKSERVNELLYPFRFGLLMALLANVLAAALLVPAFKHRNALWIIPLSLVLLSYPQAVLVWNADANEIARHSISHVIMLRLGFWMILLFAADFTSTQIKPLIDRKLFHA